VKVAEDKKPVDDLPTGLEHIPKEFLEGFKWARERLRQKQAKARARKEAATKRGAERDVSYDAASSSGESDDDD